MCKNHCDVCKADVHSCCVDVRGLGKKLAAAEAKAKESDEGWQRATKGAEILAKELKDAEARAENAESESEIWRTRAQAAEALSHRDNLDYRNIKKKYAEARAIAEEQGKAAINLSSELLEARQESAEKDEKIARLMFQGNIVADRLVKRPLSGDDDKAIADWDALKLETAPTNKPGDDPEEQP